MATDFCDVMTILKPKGYDGEYVTDSGYLMGKRFLPGILVFLGLSAAFIAYVYWARPTWFQYIGPDGQPTGQINPWTTIIFALIFAFLVGWLVHAIFNSR